MIVNIWPALFLKARQGLSGGVHQKTIFKGRHHLHFLFTSLNFFFGGKSE